MNPVEIRPPKPADLEALGVLMGQLGYPATPEAMERRLTRLAEQPGNVVFVAEWEGRVAGAAMAHLAPAIHLDEPVAMLVALVVADGVRGQGVGRRLVAAVEAWGREHEARRMSVTSNVARHGAHAFYERLGYEHTGRRYLKMLS